MAMYRRVLRRHAGHNNDFVPWTCAYARTEIRICSASAQCLLGLLGSLRLLIYYSIVSTKKIHPCKKHAKLLCTAKQRIQLVYRLSRRVRVAPSLHDFCSSKSLALGWCSTQLVALAPPCPPAALSLPWPRLLSAHWACLAPAAGLQMLHVRTPGMASLPLHSLELWGLLACMLIHQWKDCQVFTDSPRPESARVLMHCLLCALDQQLLCR